MTPRFSAGQNKMRLIAVFLFTVLMALAFQFYKVNRQHPPDTGIAGVAETVDESMFIGLRHASAKEIRMALPEAIGKPTLLAFSSKLCHDCQRMAPVLSRLMPKHPGIYYKKIDVLEDRAKYPAVFRMLKPVSVPMLVFIDRKGEIRNVLYNYQSLETLAPAVAALERPAKPAAPSAGTIGNVGTVGKN